MEHGRIRELIGYLVSMASLHDVDNARKFAAELNELLPPAKHHDVSKFYTEGGQE